MQKRKKRRKGRDKKKEVEGGEIKTATGNKCEPYVVENFTPWCLEGSVAGSNMFVVIMDC